MNIEWDVDAVIVSNLPTLGYKVYLDDLSGNTPTVVFDTTKYAITTTTTIKGLISGRSYKATV